MIINQEISWKYTSNNYNIYTTYKNRVELNDNFDDHHFKGITIYVSPLSYILFLYMDMFIFKN